MAYAPKITNEQAEELYVNQGLTMCDIASKLSVSPGCVRSALTRAGIPVRKRTVSTQCQRRSAETRFLGCGQVSGCYMYSLRRNAKTRNLKFELTATYLWELFQKQKGRCALSGVELVFPKTHGPQYLVHQTASVDRINNSKAVGYVIGNVRWIHKDLQWMRSDFEDTHFINWCHLVSQHNPESRTF